MKTTKEGSSAESSILLELLDKKAESADTSKPTPLPAYLKSVFGPGQQINTLAEARRMLETMFLRSCDHSKTDVDSYYEKASGSKKSEQGSKPAKESSMAMKDVEDTKGLPEKRVAYLEKCKSIGKLGPVDCRMSQESRVGNIEIKGEISALLQPDRSRRTDTAMSLPLR